MNHALVELPLPPAGGLLAPLAIALAMALVLRMPSVAGRGATPRGATVRAATAVHATHMVARPHHRDAPRR